MEKFYDKLGIEFHFFWVYTFSVICSYLTVWAKHHNYRLRVNTSYATILIILKAVTTLKFLYQSRFHTQVQFGHLLQTMR